MTTGVRCEAPYCDEPMTLIVSRVDAIRDYWYVCSWHADTLPEGCTETSKLSQNDLIMALTYWPPKHRSASREDAKRVMAAANAGTVSMEETGMKRRICRVCLNFSNGAHSGCQCRCHRWTR